MGSRLTPLPPPRDEGRRAERRSRLEELTRLIEEGRYEIPASAVAEAIIRFHRRER